MTELKKEWFVGRGITGRLNCKDPQLSNVPKVFQERIVGNSLEWSILDDYGWNPSKERKMKFAPVVPVRFYQQFLVNNYVPKNVLLLAHDVTANADKYAETFADPAWDNTTIFMDNSLVELKKAVDIEMVVDAVNIINRQQIVVICPDVMAEAQASAKLTRDAWPEWSWRFRNHQKLVVLQGSNMQGFLECTENLAELDPDWVSIPRVTEGLWGYHRFELIPYVMSAIPGAKIHLLGFSNYIWEDLRAASHPAVSSIDSAVPFRMETMNIFSEVVKPRDPDWFEHGVFKKDMIERAEKIDDIIERLYTVGA